MDNALFLTLLTAGAAAAGVFVTAVVAFIFNQRTSRRDDRKEVHLELQVVISALRREVERLSDANDVLREKVKMLSERVEALEEIERALRKKLREEGGG